MHFISCIQVLMVRKGRQNRTLDQGRRRLFLAVCIKDNYPRTLRGLQ